MKTPMSRAPTATATKAVGRKHTIIDRQSRVRRSSGTIAADTRSPTIIPTGAAAYAGLNSIGCLSSLNTANAPPAMVE